MLLNSVSERCFADLFTLYVLYGLSCFDGFLLLACFRCDLWLFVFGLIGGLVTHIVMRYVIVIVVLMIFGWGLQLAACLFVMLLSDVCCFGVYFVCVCCLRDCLDCWLFEWYTVFGWWVRMGADCF